MDQIPSARRLERRRTNQVPGYCAMTVYDEQAHSSLRRFGDGARCQEAASLAQTGYFSSGDADGKSSGSSAPVEPMMTPGLPSLYSGAVFNWSWVSASLILLSFLTAPLKCSAPQSMAILRLPTPRKPPKSITAARACP